MKVVVVDLPDFEPELHIRFEHGQPQEPQLWVPGEVAENPEELARLCEQAKATLPPTLAHMGE